MYTQLKRTRQFFASHPAGSFPFSQIYGEESEEVGLLRQYRDDVLSTTHEGRELIKLYYQWYPVVVRTMEEDEDFKEDVKELLDGVLEMIEKCHS